VREEARATAFPWSLLRAHAHAWPRVAHGGGTAARPRRARTEGAKPAALVLMPLGAPMAESSARSVHGCSERDTVVFVSVSLSYTTYVGSQSLS
jgi:hypothetical protein